MNRESAMRSFTRTLSTMLLTAALAAPSFAQESPDANRANPGATSPAPTDAKAAFAEAREKVTLLLSGYEYFPSREDLDRVAPADVMVDVLRSLADEADGRPAIRLRAIDALGFYSEPGAVRYLEQRVAPPAANAPDDDPRTLRLMRHRAMTALGRALGERALTALNPYLDDDDLQIRLSAISAIGNFGGEAGKKMLRELKTRDTHHAVQRELHKFVP